MEPHVKITSIIIYIAKNVVCMPCFMRERIKLNVHRYPEKRFAHDLVSRIFAIISVPLSRIAAIICFPKEIFSVPKHILSQIAVISGFPKEIFIVPKHILSHIAVIICFLKEIYALPKQILSPISGCISSPEGIEERHTKSRTGLV